jgi:hypothetical protein
MGEYITLKFEAEITDAGRDVVNGLTLKGGEPDPWQLVVEAAPGIFPARQVARYLTDYRRNFIPFGVLGQPPRHMPDLWCKNVNRLTEHTWKVVCAVKTRSTIDHFLADVLPYILEADCTATTWEEENDEPITQHIKPKRPQ